MSRLEGVTTLLSTMTLCGYSMMLLLLISIVAGLLYPTHQREKIDLYLSRLIGLLLICFAVLRPIGLTRDDLAYLDIIKRLCPLGDCTKGESIFRDYVWYCLVKFGAHYWPENLRVALVLSGFGVFIKLFVIDRLCSQRLLALLLYIPICYLQFDLTQLRAGFAISWMMLGVYAIVRSHVWVGAAFFCTNGLVHSQGFLSPALLCYRVFGIRRWVLPMVTTVALVLIYGGFYPRLEFLSWMRNLRETMPYYAGIQSGAYEGVRVFPWGYFLILAYGVWLCDAMRNQNPRIVQIVSAGLALGMLVAWFFAANPSIQTRVFEFYAVPLVLLAGNVVGSKSKIILTCILALGLYLRLELLHDWILG